MSEVGRQSEAHTDRSGLARSRTARASNSDVHADKTAGVVEQVWRLGRQAGLVDVQPIGAVTVGLAPYTTRYEINQLVAELGALG